MLSLKQYKLTRRGLVNFKVRGPDHCGTVNHVTGGSIPVRYTVVLHCNHNLDEHGFLIDNMYIHHFMEEQAEAGTDLSCELLVERLCSTLLSRMHGDEPSLAIESMDLGLSPEPYEVDLSAHYGG